MGRNAGASAWRQEPVWKFLDSPAFDAFNPRPACGATFAGTASGGTLTVTDGTHTAHIALRGNFTASTFTTSSDGHGGTIVVDPTTPAATHRFIAAAASLGAGGGGLVSVAHEVWRVQPVMLGKPAVMSA